MIQPLDIGGDGFIIYYANALEEYISTNNQLDRRFKSVMRLWKHTLNGMVSHSSSQKWNSVTPAMKNTREKWQ